MSEAEETINGRLAALDRLDLPALRIEWGKAFGRPVPPRLGRDLLAWRRAYRSQEQAWGGLQPAARGRLQRLAGDPQAGQPRFSSTARSASSREGHSNGRDRKGGCPDRDAKTLRRARERPCRRS